MAAEAVQSALQRASAALDHGQAGEAASVLSASLKRGRLSQDDELRVRGLLTEALLQQGEIGEATTTLGRQPDTSRNDIPDATLSLHWRLHGRIAFARGDQSRAIALLCRALKHAELAHESRAIGLAHYELARCYKQVGDSGIVRDHLTDGGLSAARRRRSASSCAGAFAVWSAARPVRSAMKKRLRPCARANGWPRRSRPTTCSRASSHNQANVALIRHRYEQALVLAERSVSLHETLGSGHGLAVALATLGQTLRAAG